jgi:glycosyltransferase involved in cell wall biosynthesis
MRRLRICLIASSRFPVAEPFAGGLEAHTHSLARELRARGHEISLFAAAGSDPELMAGALDVERFVSSEQARSDVAAPPEQWMREHHAYLALMLELGRSGADRFDVVHNNSIHHLPVAMAGTIAVPMVTTLHTPPVPWLESAILLQPAAASPTGAPAASPSGASHGPSRFVAVSRDTADRWAHATTADVVLNGIDTDRWREGPGGGDAVWFGRIVPEKAPHLAIEAARLAGRPLVLAGPVHDREYFARAIEPQLDDTVRYAGHLTTDELVDLVGSSAVSIVTPAWPEPYGLVAAESMSCGTPVAALATGALPELVTPSSGRLAPPGDPAALARAIEQAAAVSRTTTRQHALDSCSVGAMVDAYEAIYAELAGFANVAHVDEGAQAA